MENFEKLLDEFKKLPDRVERPPTFMEIAGYPHHENACSNILAFFMDPQEPHGLGTLILDALVSSSNIATLDEGIGGNVSVEREVSTNAGNRIDVLITSDEHTILIENKIYAAANNPFDDYADYLDTKANGRTKHKLLLTISPTSEGCEWGFKNLTHEEFVDQARSLLGRYVSSADTRYLTIFLDFLNTLENLRRGTSMDSDFVELLAKREEEAGNLFHELTRFKNELRKKVVELRKLIDVTEYGNVDQRFYRERTSLYDDLITDVSVSKDLTIRVETSIFPTGWEIWIWPVTGDYRQLKDLLNRLEIPFKEHEEDGGVEHLDSFKHQYSENLDGINSLLQDLIDKLATVEETK